jgi:hypothetical protein
MDRSIRLDRLLLSSDLAWTWQPSSPEELNRPIDTVSAYALAGNVFVALAESQGRQPAATADH